MTTINTQQIAQMKETYKQWLFTREGKELMRHSTQIRKQWAEWNDGADITFNTASVKPSLICKEIRDRATKIKITPMGFNNLCHRNAEVFAMAGAGKAVKGWNLTTCPCGKYQNYELHSVNKNPETGELCDYTHDFNKETEKWFIAMDTSSTALDLIDTFGSKVRSINKGCTCDATWKHNDEWIKKTTEKAFVKEMLTMETITIMRF
jgi:hypothetical protein